ncbi:MAG: hypothetical protein HC896_07590 [Bacteroidales bacterium]|nr:hypothetical protein [Bacteroidales bacterium]
MGSRQHQVIKAFEGHTDNIYEFAFTPDGKYFASASRDKLIRLWNIETGSVVRIFSGHDIGVATLDISHNGKWMVTGSFDGQVKLWELSNGNCLYTFTKHKMPVSCVRFAPNGSAFYSASKDGTVVKWKIDKGFFVNQYFESELLEKINESGLFQPKQKGETRGDYSNRMAKADAYQQQLFDEYYKKYIEIMQAQKVEQ